MMAKTPDARELLALLASPSSRHVIARLEIGDSLATALGALSPGRGRKVADRLRSSGLIDGADSFRPEAFAHALAAVPGRAKREGIDRYFTEDGRLARYPRNAQERRELLARIARGVLGDGEVVSERTLGDRLAAVTDDVALLRRWMVDDAIVERSRTGSEYALVVDR